MSSKIIIPLLNSSVLREAYMQEHYKIETGSSAG